MDIWQACKDQISHQTLSGKLIRIVESQEQIATNHLVETLDEQQLLEHLLENNKPKHPHPDNSRTDLPLTKNVQALHYLLATPFRYPPLKYGSRFGKKSEPGLLYGSKKITTALAETAYYRFIFWQGMSIAPTSNKFVTQHTSWTANYHTSKGMALHLPPFNDFQQQIASPDSYQASQTIGAKLRDFGTDAFEFTSARDLNSGINVALFTPKALSSHTPTQQLQWLCETSDDNVSFYSARQQEIHSFTLRQFLLNDYLPTPAV